MRLEASGNGDEEQRVVCPVCGYECVHIESVSVTAGSIALSVTHDGVSTENAFKGLRGSSYTVRYWGECGHYWMTHTHLHKGYTLVKTHSLPDIEEDASCHPPDLWRD